VLKVKISFDTNAQDPQVLLDEIADLYDTLTLLQAATLNNGYQVHIEAYDSATEVRAVSTDRQASYVFNVSPTVTTDYDFFGSQPLAHDLTDLDVDRRLIK
jgi:hypothetical protein